jgi:hypothetical protein
MEDKMKRVMLLFLLAVVLLPQTTFGGLKGDNDSQPLVSGTTQGNVGCVILEKHMPVKGKLLLAGVVYARTEYDVLETFNYKMEKQKFTGKGEIEDLNRLAVRDKIKLAIIPSKHTPEQLEQARKLCGQ